MKKIILLILALLPLFVSCQNKWQTVSYNGVSVKNRLIGEIRILLIIFQKIIFHNIKFPVGQKKIHHL
jgi:hypothetical protein